MLCLLLLLACTPTPTAAPASAPPTAPPPAEPSHALILRPVLLPAVTGPTPYPDDLSYLADELRWIEARARRIALTERLRARAHPPTPEQRARLAARTHAETQLRAHIDARRAASAPVALDRLCAALGLDTFERLVLLLAAAPCCSRRFEDIFGLLDKDGMPNSLTVEVVFRFAELSFAERIRHRAAFSPGSPLVSEDLVVVDLRQRAIAPRDLLGADLELTGRTFAYLIGEAGVTDELAAFSSVEAPLAQLEEVVLPDEDRHRIQAVVDRHDDYLALRAAWGLDGVVRYGRGALLLFYGPPGTGKTMTAHGVADRMGRQLLNVDVPTFLAHEEAGRFLPGLFREARLQGAVLFFDECETLLGSRASGNILISILLTELERFDGVAILATNRPEQLDDAVARRILVRVRFREPDADARAAIWRRHLPQSVPRAPDVDLDALARRYPLSGGDIKNAVLAAVAEALYDGSPEQLSATHLDRAARAQLSRPTTAPLLTPKQTLDDLILPAAQEGSLRGIVRAVAGDQRAMIAISGPPGVGKTAAAAALAAELGRALLPASPQTLRDRADEATRQHAVLLIEGLPNTPLDPETLRALCTRPGLTIIECHEPTDLDPDLRTRLDVLIALPLPDQDAREALWRRLLPEHIKQAPALSKTPLSGGEMAQIVATIRATDQPLSPESIQRALQNRPRTLGFKT